VEPLSQSDFQKKFVLYSGIITLIFLLVFGTTALFKGAIFHGTILLIILVVVLISLSLMIIKDNISIGEITLSFIGILLMSYLTVTGGCCDGTGILWAYPIIVIILLLKGFLFGLMSSLIYLAVVLFVFFGDQTFVYQYETSFKVRFLSTFFLLAGMAFIYEYLRSTSHRNALIINEKLNLTSRLDPLTELLNRRAAVTEFEREFSIYQRHGNVFSIIILDLDNFKQINDTYGHATGDQALIEVAKQLTSHTRSEDIVVRWGGEEFVIILPGTDLQQAAIKAKNIKQQLSSINYQKLGVSDPITASFGVQSINNSTDVDDLFVQADKKLYEAKKRGRNQVVS